MAEQLMATSSAFKTNMQSCPEGLQCSDFIEFMRTVASLPNNDHKEAIPLALGNQYTHCRDEHMVHVDTFFEQNKDLVCSVGDECACLEAHDQSLPHFSYHREFFHKDNSIATSMATLLLTPVPLSLSPLSLGLLLPIVTTLPLQSSTALQEDDGGTDDSSESEQQDDETDNMVAEDCNNSGTSLQRELFAMVDRDEQNYDGVNNRVIEFFIEHFAKLYLSCTQYMNFPPDICRLICEYYSWRKQIKLFKYRLGWLTWRCLYGGRTRKILRKRYGSSYGARLKAFKLGVSECIHEQQFEAADIRRDIQRSQTNSRFVDCIARNLSDLQTKPREISTPKANSQYKDIHEMLHEIVFAPIMSRPMRLGSSIACSPQCSRSSTSVGILAFKCLSSWMSPKISAIMVQSMQLSMADSPMDLDEVIENFAAGFPIDRNITCKPKNSTVGAPESSETMDMLERVYKTLREQAPSFVAYITEDVEHRSHLRKPCVIAKYIDIFNQKAIVLNTFNLFCEIRMRSHYIHSVGCKSPSSADCDQPALSVNEFLNNYPCFQRLRENHLHKHSIDCIAATVTNITEKILPPLPIHNIRYIIDDNYRDYLVYTTQISRFIARHAALLQSQLSHEPDFPMQFDFLIIPQCVSEVKLYHRYDDMIPHCEPLPFGVGKERIGDIGEHLTNCGIDFVQQKLLIQLNGSAETVQSALLRQLLQLHEQNRSAWSRRYIFVIDRRRSPSSQFDGSSCLNPIHKTWSDWLYLFSPPKYNEIVNSAIPESFLHRTLQYLLPLNQESHIGAKNVANGYLFCLSYHLFEKTKMKSFFYLNGCGQRFTKFEAQYYWPRLFRKINGKFQNEFGNSGGSGLETSLELFEDIADEYDAEHHEFHCQTMQYR